MSEKRITIIGAGLAGSELALQLAEAGFKVRLLEMKPQAKTPAQTSDYYAELVCSNSFRASSLLNAVGLLKEEMRRLGSFVMEAADQSRVPAGGALAVNRQRFSAILTEKLKQHPNIQIQTVVVSDLPSAEEGDVVVATGPLTTEAFAQSLERLLGQNNLYFYDAIAPIVAADSIDFSRGFFASRYGKGGDDYFNIPLTEEEYNRLIDKILKAEKVAPHEFEDTKYFEGCLPIETLCERGRMTPAFGPFKPVGLIDPRTGKEPFAVIQLRKEDEAGTAYNIVGFQTKMTYSAQREVIRSIPGLENVEILRYGSVHRNMFINAPMLLDEHLRLKRAPYVRFAGQITGVEGYVESAAIGLILAYIIRMEQKGKVVLPPDTTAIGALLVHLRRKTDNFQPSNIHYGLFAPPAVRLRGKPKKVHIAARALRELKFWQIETGIEPVGPVREVETL